MSLNKDYSSETVVSRFISQMAKNPDKVAFYTETDLWTYGFLHNFSNQIAAVVAENYDDRYKLTKRERTRYTRQMLLDGWGIESQEKLKATTVFVAGAGGSGSPLIMQLALCGFGNIIICDFDEVDLSNLNRQCLHDESRIGVNKALSAQLTVSKMNPNVKVIPRTERITRENVYQLVGDAEIIFDNVDDLETKLILSECAVEKGIPHIISSMIELSSYVAIFHSPYTLCLHCIYDRGKIEAINEIKKLVKDYKKAPIPVSSPALFLSTGFACNEAIKILLGMENPAHSTYFLFNQKSTKNVINTAGYRMISYPFNEHFRKLSKEQGFDWDEGWRGKWVEEIHLTPDPNCPICGKRHGKTVPKPINLSNQAEVAAGTEISSDKQTVALLLAPGAKMAAGLLGIFKSGKTCVALDITKQEDHLDYILGESEARVIVTDEKVFPLTQEIRDRVNKNIKIINLDTLPTCSTKTTPEIFLKKETIALGFDQVKKQNILEIDHERLLQLLDYYSEAYGLSQIEKLTITESDQVEKSIKHILSALVSGVSLREKRVDDLNDTEKYWFLKLKDFAYTDLPRKTLKAGTDYQVQKLISLEKISKKVDNYCIQNQVSKYDFYLAAFNVMVAKEINQNDIAIGIHLDREKWVQDKEVSGFLNLILFRSNVSTGAEFREYLQTFKEAFQEIKPNQGYPYEWLSMKAKEDWGFSGGQLVSLVFNYLPGDRRNIEEFLLESECDLNFFVVDDGTKVEICIIYNSEIYEDYIIERNLLAYQVIIETVLQNQTIQIREIEIGKESSVNEFMLDFVDDFENDELI